jgi:hypothetical protein
MIARSCGLLLAGLAAVTAATGVRAQAPPVDAAAAALPPQYEVEIIVFANREFDPTEERFDQTPESFDGAALGPLATPPVFDETTFAPPVLGGTPAAPLPPQPPPDPAVAAALEAMRIRMLSPEQLTLNNEYRRISTIPAYAPLLHTGWIQPGLAEADAPTLDLATLGILNPSGTVRVHLARFLHITLDLTYQAATAETAAPGAGDGLDELALAPRYRLKTTRSARSGELHYFDHPAFGVLVRVRPVAAQATTTTSRRPAA